MVFGGRSLHHTYASRGASNFRSPPPSCREREIKQRIPRHARKASSTMHPPLSPAALSASCSTPVHCTPLCANGRRPVSRGAKGGRQAKGKRANVSRNKGVSFVGWVANTYFLRGRNERKRGAYLRGVAGKRDMWPSRKILLASKG